MRSYRLFSLFVVFVLLFSTGSIFAQASMHRVEITSSTAIAENALALDGSDLVVNGVTLVVDGAHSYNNVSIINGGVLTHSPATNTSEFRLELTISGTLKLDSASKIDVTGKGYLAGYTAGNTTTGGATSTAGGSYGGLGNGVTTNPTYGDFKDPNYPGAGAGGGASGGGLVRITAGSAVIDGQILANGANGANGWFGYPAGAGGGIRLSVGALSGSGSIHANGGLEGWGAGGGRTAVYYTSNGGFDLSKVTAIGGVITDHPQWYNGAPGTVYLKQGSSAGTLRIDNGADPTSTWTPLGVAGQSSVDVENLLLSGSGALAAPEHNLTITAASVTIQNGAVLTHQAATDSAEYALLLNISGVLNIDATSKIDVTGKGYLPGRTAGNTTTGGATGSAGGSYGGLGNGGSTNRTYGDFKDPNYPGAGAGGGESGGGLVRITAGSAVIDGQILANGTNGANGWGAGPAGAGGGIRLSVGALSGSGSIHANGGLEGWGAGGGRTAVYYTSISGFDLSKVTATGGVITDQPQWYNGAPGTVYLKQGSSAGTLRIDNGANPTSTWTPLGVAGQSSVDVENLLLSGPGAIASPDHEMVVNAASVLLEKGAQLTHLNTTELTEYSLDLNVTGALTVDADSKIDVTRRGYMPGHTSGNTQFGAATGSSGGSYGGLGSPVSGATNATYGTPQNPIQPGAGGALPSNISYGGFGGGVVRINAGSFTLNGSILANGAGPAYNGGGAGGSVLINTNTLAGSGAIQANGGDSGNGGGGGGRIAIYTWTSRTLPGANITANPGTGSGPGAQAGTILLSPAPFFSFDFPVGNVMHGIEQLGWSILGVNPAPVTVDVNAISAGGSTALASGAPGASAPQWDTTGIADGWYTLQAVFKSGSTVRGEVNRQALVLNGVTWHTGTLTGTQSWAAGTIHVVSGDLRLASGAHLSIAPGAVVKFLPRARIVVGDGAFLDAPSAPTPRAILTSLTDDTAGGDTNLDSGLMVPLAGEWNGIVKEGSGVDNFSSQADIRYARIEHSGALAGSETWSGPSVHIIKTDVSVPSGATLTIQAGAVVKFETGQRLEVKTGGILQVQGILAQPVVFTSSADDSAGGDTNFDGNLTVPTAGDWRDIYLNGGTASFTYARIRYAGFGGAVNPTGAIMADANAQFTLTNSTISDALYDGIYLRAAQSAVVTNCIIARTDRAIDLNSGTISMTNCTLDANRIGVWGHGGSITSKNSIIAHSLESGVTLLTIGGTITLRYSDVWSTTGPNFTGMANPVGTNGVISADPRLVNPNDGDYRLGYVSPAIDAADGPAAPPLDYNGAPRYDDPRTPNTGIISNGTYADMGAFEFVEGAASNIDLTVLSVSGPASLVAGTQATLTWTVMNLGSSPAVGPWHDRAYLTLSPGLTPSDFPAGEFLVGSGLTLGQGQTATFSKTISVPYGPVSSQYGWKVNTNARGEVFEGTNVDNNIGISQIAASLDLPALVVGASATSGQFSTAGDTLYYKVIPTPGQDFSVSLDLTGSGVTELYSKLGALPTTQTYENRSQQFAAADTSLVVNQPENGTYYIQAVAPKLSASPSSFTIRALAASFSIQSVSPNKGGHAGVVTLAVSGQSFPQDAVVKLVKGATSLLGRSQRRIDSSRLEASFDPGTLPVGMVDVVVYSPTAGTRTLASGFEAQAGGEAEVWTRLEGPAQMRAGREVPLTLHWGNRGNIDAPMQLLRLPLSSQGKIALVPGGEGIPYDLLLLGFDDKSPERNLPPGYSGSRTVYFTPNLGRSVALELKAASFNDLASTPAVNWNLYKADLKLSWMSDAEWNAFWAQLTTRLGANPASMANTLAQTAFGYTALSNENGLLFSTALTDIIGKALQTAGIPMSPADGTSADLQNMAGITQPYTLNALIVSNSYYKNNFPSLPPTETDHTKVKYYLLDNAQLPLTRLQEMQNNVGHPNAVTKATLLKNLNTLADPTNTNARRAIYFHFSGHGDRTGLLTGGGSNLTVSFEEIFNTLNASHAGRIVLTLEACESGGMVDLLHKKVTGPPQDLSILDRWVVVTSASSSQDSYSGGIFQSDGGGWMTEAIFWCMSKGGSSLFDCQQKHKTLSYLTSTQKSNTQWFGNDHGFDFNKSAWQSFNNLFFGPHGPGTVLANAIQGTNPGFLFSTILGSFDPNEKNASGKTSKGYTPPDQPITFTIYFENDPAHGATAPVQELLITDQLNSQLDWSTLQLGTIGFGDQRINLPPGLKDAHIRLTLPGGVYVVDAQANLDVLTGKVTWHVSTIDPVTQDLPADPVAGFLAVNDSQGHGAGYVIFTVMPKASLVTGATITNQAIITFDPTYGVNPPITTNTTTNTIGEPVFVFLPFIRK